MRRDGIGQTAGVVDAGQRGQYLRRYFLVELDILVEQVEYRTHQHLGLTFVDGRGLLEILDRGRKIPVGLEQALDQHTFTAFNQHLDCAVGQFEHLQDGRQRPDLVEIFLGRVVDFSVLLGEQQDFLVVLHGGIQCLDRLFPADEQRDDHVRINHHVSQR